jgi:hypothetical protein
MGRPKDWLFIQCFGGPWKPSDAACVGIPRFR